MKTFSIKFSEFLQALRKWFKPESSQDEEKQIFQLPITEQAELLQLCGKIFGKTESAVRREIRNLSIHEMETLRENTIPRRGFKGLRVECEEYALWIEFSTLDNKKRKEKQWLYCYHLWLFYTGERNRQELMRALENEEEYYRLWENSYIDIETNKIKITHGKDPLHPELPYHITFTPFRMNK